MAEHRIPIAGMTCAACERTVVTAVRGLPGVSTARADRRAGIVTVIADTAPPDAAVDEALTGTPYRVGTRPWLARDASVWRDLAIAVLAVGGIAAILVATGAADAAGRLTSLATTGSLVFIALLGVAASVSTCMALVGGLVMSLAASAPAGGGSLRRMRPHLAFNAGRIVGFAALGALVGAVGSALALSGTVLAVAMLAVAAVMALLGVRLTGASPRLAAWQVSLPASWGSWAQRSDTGRPASDARAALLGAASFFLPCGFTQAVQVLALSSGSAAQGAAIMAAFAVGTTPGLLAAGAAASAARRRGAARALRVVGVVVLAFALVTATGAVRTLAPGLGGTTVVAAERTANVADEGGVQVATTVVQAAGYSPADTVVYVGEPVRWTLDPEAVSCAGLIDASELGVGSFEALYSPATVEFTLDEPGTYTFACTMGMYQGTVTAIPRPTEQ